MGRGARDKRHDWTSALPGAKWKPCRKIMTVPGEEANTGSIVSGHNLEPVVLSIRPAALGRKGRHGSTKAVKPWLADQKVYSSASACNNAFFSKQ